MKRRWKIITCIVVLIIIIVVAIVYITQWANSPASTTIIPPSTTQPVAKQNQAIATTFFVTAVPSDFKIQVNINKENPTMVQVSAFQTHGGGMQVGITTALLPGEGLPGVANYLYRVRNHQQYEQIPSTVFPSGSVTFRALTGDGEVTNFLINNNRYASVAISGGGVGSSKIDDLLVIMAKNWKWL